MFKIVQTREKNKTLLSIVPHLWENGNKLYWPVAGEIKRKRFEKMLQDGNSAPLNHWKLYPCRLKRRNLTYEQAVHETKKMFDQSNTDACTIVQQEKLKYEDPLSPTNNVISSQPSSATNTSKSRQQQQQQQQHHQSLGQNGLFQNENEHFRMIDDESSSNFGGCSMNAKGLLQISDAVLEQLIPTNLKIDQMLQSQQSMAFKISKLEAKLGSVEEKVEKILRILLSGQRFITHNSETANKPSKKESIDVFTKIHSIDALNEFEKKLANSQYKNATLSQMKRICNTNNRNLQPLDVCYEFVDAIFTRELFTQTSWAGGSKSGTPKTAFKTYSHTIDFFITLVREIHSNFSQSTCLDFFKNKVISNSTARAKSTPKRVSRIKHRKKNFTLQLADETAGETDNSDNNDGDDAESEIVADEIKSIHEPVYSSVGEMNAIVKEEYGESTMETAVSPINSFSIIETDSVTCSDTVLGQQQSKRKNASGSRNVKRMRPLEIGFPVIHPQLLSDSSSDDSSESDIEDSEPLKFFCNPENE